MGDGFWMGLKCQNWGQKREDVIMDYDLDKDFTDGAKRQAPRGLQHARAG